MLEIDVDVGRFTPLRRDEALEQQVGAVGIDLGDAEAETDRGIGRRAAALAEDFLRTGVADDVVDGEEVGRVGELRDQRQLVLDCRAHFFGQALRIALRRAFVGQMRQRRLRVRKAVDGLVGIFVAQFVEREGKLLAQMQRFLDRLRRVAEQPRHFFAGFEEALGIGGKAPAGAIDDQLLADAGDDVGERAAVGMVIMHVVDGDQRHARLARQVLAAREPRPVAAAIEHRRGEVHATGGCGAECNKQIFYFLLAARSLLPPPERGRVGVGVTFFDRVEIDPHPAAFGSRPPPFRGR